MKIGSVVLAISLLALFLTGVGLIKPWPMLWWRDVQNRRGILKLYGSITAFGSFVYWLLTLF
jgi:hypothetical protein